MAILQNNIIYVGGVYKKKKSSRHQESFCIFNQKNDIDNKGLITKRYRKT